MKKRITSRRSWRPDEHPLAGVAALDEHVPVKWSDLLSGEAGSQVKAVDVLGDDERGSLHFYQLCDGHVSFGGLKQNNIKF